MGQLEKYGLYVLCLVIFLILGVTIWGGGEAPTNPGRSTSAAIHAPGAPPPAAPTPQRAADTGTLPRTLAEVLAPGAATVRTNGANGAANPAGPTGGEPRRDEGTAAPGGTPRPEPKPAATPATPAAPARVAYLVRDKDTLESVARAKLGSAALWPEIVKLNPGLEPTRVRAGKEIWLPGPSAVAALQQPKAGPAIAPLADGRTYTVKKGDNYERIAMAQLGSKRRAQELMELNPTIEPTRLRPGHRLTLPAK